MEIRQRKIANRLVIILILFIIILSIIFCSSIDRSSSGELLFSVNDSSVIFDVPDSVVFGDSLTRFGE